MSTLERAAIQSAAWLWAAEYSKQNLSLFDWWLGLSDHRKRLARQCARQVVAAYRAKP